jgi:hypothetical protein
MHSRVSTAHPQHICRSPEAIDYDVVPRGPLVRDPPPVSRLSTGATVARAKRTARAAARRRYRAEQEQVEDVDTQEPTTTATPSRSQRPAAADSGQRRSIGAAFREAFRPLDVRADIRLLPQLVRHRAFWLPVLLALASTAIFAVVRPTTSNDVPSLVAAFLFQYFIVTPGIGAVFIAGFLAQRASWLIGGLVGLVTAACYSFLGVAGFIPFSPNQPQPVARDVVLAAFGLSPILGAFFASAAAWYRRFLTLSNPNRGRPGSSANAGRRPDGRTRAAPNKAGVRR